MYWADAAASFNIGPLNPASLRLLTPGRLEQVSRSRSATLGLAFAPAPSLAQHFCPRPYLRSPSF
jgi:hypothetical protein